MAGPEPRVPYNPTQEVTPEVGSPSNYIRTQASPQAFGSSSGQATQGLGKTEESLANPLVDYAVKRQGQLNEASAVNAETQTNDAYAKIMNGFRTKELLQARDSLPDTVEQLKQVRQKIRETMPNDASAKSYDMLVARSEGFVIRDAGSWAASQENAFFKKSASDSINSFATIAGSPSVAVDDQRFNETLDGLRMSGTAALSLEGVQTERINEDSDEGRGTKAIVDNYMQKAEGQAWENRFQTLTDPVTGDIRLANRIFQENKERIPSVAKTKIANSLASSLKNVEIRDFTNQKIAEVDATYQKVITTPLTSDNTDHLERVTQAIKNWENGKPNENLMQIKSHEVWNRYAQEGDQISDPVANERVGRAFIQHLYEKYHGDTSRVASAYFSGEDNTTDEGPSPFKDDYYSQKINSTNPTVSFYINQIEKQMQGKDVGVETPYLNKADYITLHKDDILQDTRKQLEEKYTGRPGLVEQGVAQVNQQLTGEQTRQRAVDHYSLQSVYKYMNDMEDKGTPIISRYQFQQAPPEVRAAVRVMESEYADNFKNLMDRLTLQNARGKSQSYGSDFYSIFKDVASGKITSTLQLGPSLDGIKLTNSGFPILNDFINDQATPEGKSFTGAMIPFLDRMHTAMTFNVPGIPDEHGDNLFREFMQQSLPEMQSKRKESGIKMFNPEDKSYVGSGAHIFIRTDTEKREDYDKAIRNLELPSPDDQGQKSLLNLKSFDQETDTKQGMTGLKKLYDNKDTTPAQKQQIKDYAVSRGWGSKK